jgi:tetratricopeptide (TPR) repeat protein
MLGSRLLVRLFSTLMLAAQMWAAEQPAVAEAMAGRSLAREGKFDLAIEHYRAALRLDPKLPALYLNLGLAYFKSQRLAEAIKAFEEAVRADGGSFQAHALLGMSYYGGRRYAKAAEQLKLAAASQPDNLELRYNLAQSYMFSQQYPEALAEFKFLLSNNPDSAPVHLLLGEALDASNRTQEATAEFEAAVKASPVPADAHFGLGYLYWKQRRYSDARHAFETELAGQPRHLQCLTYLGDTEMNLDEDKAAEQHLRIALARDKTARLAHLDLGILLAKRKAPDEAIQEFREAIRLLPSQPDAHYRLGRLLKELGREKEAQEEFDKVKKLAGERAPPPLPLVQLPGRPGQ